MCFNNLMSEASDFVKKYYNSEKVRITVWSTLLDTQPSINTVKTEKMFDIPNQEKYLQLSRKRITMKHCPDKITIYSKTALQ